MSHEETARAVRLADDRLSAERGTFHIDSPLIYNDGNAEELEIGVDVNSSRDPEVRLFFTATDGDVTIGETAYLNPDTARELAGSLWAAADVSEDGDSG